MTSNTYLSSQLSHAHPLGSSSREGALNEGEMTSTKMAWGEYHKEENDEDSESNKNSWASVAEDWAMLSLATLTSRVDVLAVLLAIQLPTDGPGEEWKTG